MSDMPLEYASVLGDLIDSLRFQNVTQPLSRRARFFLAQLDRVTDGDVERAIKNERARIDQDHVTFARHHDAYLRERTHPRIAHGGSGWDAGD